MRDYAELAESLRLCAKYGNAENALANAETAADAIEELLKKNDELENSGKLLVAAFDRLKEKVPKWISVEERLPKTDDFVIVAVLDERGDTPYQYTDFG